VEAILKQRGRPMLVANRYSAQEYLIGPLLFPVYRFVLKIVAASYLVPWGLISIGQLIFGRAYAGHTGPSWGSLWSGLWFTAFLAMGTVTLVFGVLEWVQARSHFLDEWDPRKLPRIVNHKLIKRSTSSMELAFNLAAFVWWAANMSSQSLQAHWGIALSPLWPYFFWGFLLVGSVNSGLAAANLLRPYWTRMRAIVRLISDCAGAALFCWALKANILTGLVMPNVSSERALEITNALNLLMATIFPWAIAVTLIIAICDTLRIRRLMTSRVRPPWDAARIMTA